MTNTAAGRRCLVGLVALAAAAGACHRPATEILERPSDTLEWPGAPARPRIRLIGTLSSSADLKATTPAMEVLKSAVRGPRPPIPFGSPNGVARHGSRLAVADSAAGAVHLVDLDERTHVTSFGSKERRFAMPVGVTFVADSVYATDGELRTLCELNPDGTVARWLDAAELDRPVGVVFVAPRRQLYVVDGGAHAVRVLDLEGQEVARFGARGSAPGQFNYPTHIAFDGRDTLAVADSGNFRVQLLSLDGAVISAIGSGGDAAGDLALPKGVAFDSAGHVYIVDARFENFQVFDRQGRLLLAVGEEGSGFGQFSLPAGMARDEDDRLWVADSANRRIQVFQYLDDLPEAQPQR